MPFEFKIYFSHFQLISGSDEHAYVLSDACLYKILEAALICDDNLDTVYQSLGRQALS